MLLTDEVVKSLHVAKIFTENTGVINAMDFTHDGSLMVSSSVDDSIITYDCKTGSKMHTLNSKKYGVDLIRITHHQTSAVHASTKVDDTVRYLSLHDNKYFRYFSGHTKRVVSLCLSRVDDTFISGSLDNTLRLWDLRSPNCQGCMHMTGSPVAAFDPEGLVFAAGINSEQIKLYDLRSFDRGPFTTFQLRQEAGCEWTNLKFSPDGKMILICTNGNIMHLVDAYEGKQLQQFSGFQNSKNIALEGGFTPDNQFVYCGSTDSKIHMWNATSGSKICILSTEQNGHRGPIQCLGFNPKYMMFASACSRMVFWLPKQEE